MPITLAETVQLVIELVKRADVAESRVKQLEGELELLEAQQKQWEKEK